MGFFKEFKDFAVKGNVMDMAVGVVVGTAFTGIVNSLVKDIIMPPIAAIMGDIKFDDLKAVLREIPAAVEGEAPTYITLNYGVFIQAVVNFLILAFSVFCVVRLINKAKAKLNEKKLEEEAAAKKAAEEEAARKAAEEAAKPTTEQLLADILTVLKEQK